MRFKLNNICESILTIIRNYKNIHKLVAHIVCSRPLTASTGAGGREPHYFHGRLEGAATMGSGGQRDLEMLHACTACYMVITVMP